MAPQVVRSPADALRLVVATTTLLALLVFDWLFGSAAIGFAADLLRGIDAIDERILAIGIAAVRLGTIVLLLVAAGAAVANGRWRAVATTALAAVAAAAVFAVADARVEAHRPALAAIEDLAGPLTDTDFPSPFAVAILAGVATAAGPWVDRRARRTAWALVLALATATVVAAPLANHAAMAVVSGWVGGAVALLALGAPAHRIGDDAVRRGLRSVGLALARLEPAKVDARGSTPYFGATTDGRPLFVKILAKDQRDADLLFRLYRWVRPKDVGDERPFSSLRRTVEHEALLSLAVERIGIRTPPFVGLADTRPPGGFVLAYEAVDGRSFDRVPPEELDDTVLDAVWAQVVTLRQHRVAHRDLRLANLFLDDQRRVWLIDFGFAELAASDLLLATDVAELVASLATTIGAERAVESARAAVGVGALRSAANRLRPAYLSGATRTAIKQQPALLDEIRELIERRPAEVMVDG
jgi:undecaprenyl-diphosphatase